MQFFRANQTAKSGLIELVGKKGAGALKYNRIPVARQHAQFGDKPTYEAVDALAQDYINRFSSGDISTVKVVYMQFISAGRQRPEVLQLLPFKPAASEGNAAASESKAKPQYEFSPSPKELLDDLLPAAVKATLFQCFMDANVSENVARMVAMKAATDNAGKMGKRLTRMYNRARQAQITTELTEIISGAAALA
jgi:F-type H+-transporting ATPase subunit gamma